jgi:hypothetical protein
MFNRNQFAQGSSHGNLGNFANAKLSEMKLIAEAKEKVRNMDKEEGTILCPKCKETLVFHYIRELNIFKLECMTDGCINIDELEQP